MKTLKNIVLFPVRLLLFVFKLAFAVLIRIEENIIAVVLFPLILSIFVCIVCKMWIQLKIFCLIAAGLFMILFVTVALQIWIETMK